MDFDISKQSRALFWLRIADYTLMVVSGVMIFGSLALIISDPSSVKNPDFMFQLIGIAILSFCLITGYRHLGVIGSKGWTLHLIAFIFLLLICPLLIARVLLLTIQLIQLINQRTPDNQVIDQLKLVLLELGFVVWATTGAICGIVCLILLRYMRIVPLAMTVKALMSNLQKERRRQVLIKGRKRVNVRRGIEHGIAGVALLGAAQLPIVGNLGGFGLTFLGAGLILKARGYFQATVESLLATDLRSPILFLRPFEDDRSGPSGWWPLASLLDFSLETRLANHFTHFGPFIAVGSPKETSPQIGAARTELSATEWQSRVVSWISQATHIVMYAGRTDWLAWELSKVIETNRVLDLILLIPEIKGVPRIDHLTARVDRVKDIFKSTKWSKNLEAIGNFHTVRALSFRDDGSLFVVRSRYLNRDSAHLSALVAHYMILSERPRV